MKPVEKIVREYHAASSPREWLEEEVAEFFTESLKGEAAREALDEALIHGTMQAEQFLQSQTTGQELANAALMYTRDGKTTGSYFTKTVSPVAILMILAATCQEGDKVVFSQQYYSGIEKVYEAHWPFGMDIAAEMTSPPDFAAYPLENTFSASELEKESRTLSRLFDSMPQSKLKMSSVSKSKDLSTLLLALTGAFFAVKLVAHLIKRQVN